MDNPNNPNPSNPDPTGAAPAPDMTSSPWPPPAQPASQPAPTPDPLAAPSTFTPQPEPLPNVSTAPSTSPLDNPWSVPTPAPDISSSPSPQPTWVPPITAAQVEPTTITTPSQPISSGPALPEAAVAPTDLSHLISNNPPAAETLVVPPQNSNPVPDVPTISTENHRGIPKWLIGVGVGLLIIVAGASAYFILGIGQPSKGTTSVPAEVSKTTVKTPPPIATPAPQPTNPAATGSANFGQLQGSQTPPATSAADLLKQRQQQAR